MAGCCEDDSGVHMENCFCSHSLDDIREFVTVVCCYNCKICDFSCGSVEDVRSHVVDGHFRKTSAPGEVIFSSKSQCKSSAVSNDSSVMDMPVPELLPSATTTSKEDSATGAVGLISKEFSTICQSSYDFLSSTVVTHAAEPSSVQPLQNTMAGQSLQLFINNEQVQLNVSNCFGADNLQEVATLPADVHVGLCVENSHRSNSILPEDLVKVGGQVIVQSVDSSDQMNEMYVCDSCGTVFNGVGIAEHMLQVHGVRMDSVNESGSQTVQFMSSDQHVPSRSIDATMPANTVSIGTQAQLAKKPGRKRKIISDVATAAEVQSSRQVEKDTAAAIAVKTLGIERLASSAVGQTVPSKRRICPPRALVEDYHIQRLRQSKPRTRSAACAPAKFLCSAINCGATFRQQQAVDYHTKCHTDGLTFCCPECHSSFVDWSSALPHLWTVHGIDLFMYQCSQCKFRSNDSSAVTKHSVAEHGGRPPGQPFLCSVCGQSFRKANVRNQHEKSHRRDRLESRDTSQSELIAFSRRICDLCKRLFANRKSLKKHIEVDVSCVQCCSLSSP